MKKFSEYIREADELRSLGGSATNQYGRWGQEPVHMGVHRIEDPNVLQRLNAHIGIINTREYIDPVAALEHLQNALMRLGYLFEYDLNALPKPQNVYELSRFGGRQGFIDMDAVYKRDDFIEPQLGEEMVLSVEFIEDPESARYTVLAQIVPESLFSEEDLEDMEAEVPPNRASVPATTGDQRGINVGESLDESVEISSGRETGKSGLWEVELAFRGGPAPKLARTFHHAAQKAFATSKISPAPNGVKVVVEVKASNSRDAQVKARTVLDAGSKRSKLAAQYEPIDEAIAVGRTFVFKSADARDRIVKLLDLQGAEAVSTSDKAKGAAKFSVSGNIKQAQLDTVMKFVKQLKGKLGEETWPESITEQRPARPRYKVGDAVDVEVDDGKYKKGKVTKVGRIQNEGIWVKVGGKTENWPIELVRHHTQKEGAEGIAEEALSRLLQERDVDRSFSFPTEAKAEKFIKDIRDWAHNVYGTRGVTGSGLVRATFESQADANEARREATKLGGKVLRESADVARKHQLKIARSTMKMAAPMAGVMGGMNKNEAAKILLKHGTAAEKKAAQKQLRRPVPGRGKLKTFPPPPGKRGQNEAKDANCDEIERTKRDAKAAAAFKEQLSKRKKNISY